MAKKHYRHNYAFKVYEVPHRFPEGPVEIAENKKPRLLDEFRTTAIRSDKIDGLLKEARKQLGDREVRSLSIGVKEVVAVVFANRASAKDGKVRSEKSRSYTK